MRPCRLSGACSLRCVVGEISIPARQNNVFHAYMELGPFIEFVQLLYPLSLSESIESEDDVPNGSVFSAICYFLRDSEEDTGLVGKNDDRHRFVFIGPWFVFVFAMFRFLISLRLYLQSR